MSKNQPQIEEPISEDNPLRKNAARLRALNNCLLEISEHFIGEIPESLEEADRLLEARYGPKLWKRIYDEIPTRNQNKDREADKEKELSKDQDKSKR